MCEFGPQLRPNYGSPVRCCILEEVLKEHLSSNASEHRSHRGFGGSWLRPRRSSSHAAPTSTFITKLLDHYGLRWSFTAFDFFFCCQTGGKWCVIWSKMLLFVFICCFKIWWLPAITLLWQGPRAPRRQGEPGLCQALWGFGANCGHVSLHQVGLRAGVDPGGHRKEARTKLRGGDGGKCSKINSSSIKENGNDLLLPTAGKPRRWELSILFTVMVVTDLKNKNKRVSSEAGEVRWRVSLFT